MDEVLTVVPAKLGSQRLPRKNILYLDGKPLLNYSLEAAHASGVCGEVMVSTESEEVAAVARQARASVPFMRPEKLGRDPYGVVDVCLHVLSGYKRLGRVFSTLIILLPTSPFRKPQHIREALELFRDTGSSFLMSVSEMEQNPYGAMRFSEQSQGLLKPCFPEHIGKKRHELPRTYRANGAITIVEVKAFEQAGTYYGTPLIGYVMRWPWSLDVDTSQDFQFAEYLLQKGGFDE